MRSDPLPDVPPDDLSARRTFTPRQIELLRQLEGVVLREGFAALTIGELAERFRCSRRTLYELAESKDEMVLLVLDRLLRRVARTAHEAVHQQTDPLERVRAFLLAGLVELRSATVNFSEDVASRGAARLLVDNHFRYATRFVQRLVDEGIAAGAFRPVHALVVAEVISAGIERVEDPGVLRAAGITFAEAMDELLSMVVNGIGIRPARPRKDRWPCTSCCPIPCAGPRRCSATRPRSPAVTTGGRGQARELSRCRTVRAARGSPTQRSRCCCSSCSERLR